MFRFSLAALLALVSFAAVGCAALVNANDLWRQTMVTLTIGLLLTATLAAIVWRGARRHLAAGFALFGWAYVVLAFVGALDMRNDMLTDKSVVWLYEGVHGGSERQNVYNPRDLYISEALKFSPDGRLIVQGEGSTLRLWDAERGQQLTGGRAVPFETVADITHSLWAVIVACLGVVVARVLMAVNVGGRRIQD